MSLIVTCKYNQAFKTHLFREGDNFASTGQKREVHIKFFCNSKVPFGSPKFTEQQGNKYFFDFQTSLVCSASAVQCSVSKGNLTYDLTPLGLVAGKRSINFFYKSLSKFMTEINLPDNIANVNGGGAVVWWLSL